MGHDTVQRHSDKGDRKRLLPDATPDGAKKSWSQTLLFHLKQPGNWLVVTLLFLTTLSNIIFKNVEIHMEHYTYTLTQMQPVMLIPSFFLLTVVRWRMGKITEGQFNFPKKRYIFMAALFAVYNFLTRFGARGNYVPGPLMVLLAQVVIPYTMVLTMIFLYVRYRPVHFLAVLMIIGGIVVAIYPSLSAISQTDSFVSVITLLVAPLPQAIVLVYLEHNFKKWDMDLYYASSWINVFEFIIGIPLIFALVPLGSLTFGELPNNIVDGYACLFIGRNARPGDNCAAAGYWYLGYWFVNVCFNVNLGYGLKTSSATFMSLALTCSLPLSAIAFSWSFLVPTPQPLSIWNVVALAIIFPGLILYKLQSPNVLPDKGKLEAVPEDPENLFPPNDYDDEEPQANGEDLVIPRGEIVLERQPKTQH